MHEEYNCKNNTSNLNNDIQIKGDGSRGKCRGNEIELVENVDHEAQL